jgi:hypothetical protein
MMTNASGYVLLTALGVGYVLANEAYALQAV